MRQDHVICWCTAAVIPFGLRQKKRIEEAEKTEETSNMQNMGIQKTAITDRQEKTGTGNYCTRAIRVSELHDLLNHHHRPNEKGLQVPVSDISKVEEGKGQLKRPSPSLYYLMDCAVPPEEQ